MPCMFPTGYPVLLHLICAIRFISCIFVCICANICISLCVFVASCLAGQCLLCPTSLAWFISMCLLVNVYVIAVTCLALLT